MHGKILWAAACAACTGFAAVYHVDDAAGDDARDGLSPTTAWRSLAKVNAADVKPGDRVLFRRGGLWRGQLDVKSGEPGRPTYYGAYGTGPKPILQGSIPRSREEDWEQIAPGLWATRRQDAAEGAPVGQVKTRWSATWEHGVMGTFAADDTVRIACTNRPAKPVPGSSGRNALQIWGPDVTGLPSALRFHFKVRGTFLPRDVDVLRGARPFLRRAQGGVKIAPKADKDGWRDAVVTLLAEGATFPDGRLHMYLGDEAKTGGTCEIKPVSLNPFNYDPARAIGCDIGILILGEGTAWGEKKWEVNQLTCDLDYCYDTAEDRVVVRLNENPAKAYGSVELAKTWTICSHGRKHDVTVEAFTLRYTGGFCFSGGGATRFAIRNCDMAWIGGGLQYWRLGADGVRGAVRYGNGVEFWSPTRDCRVERCRIWQVYDAALTPQQTTSTNGFDGVVYRDNVIWQAEYAYEFWNHSPSSRTDNVIFEHNTCVDSGYCWSHAQRPNPNGAHIMCYNHVSPGTNIVIRNNVFCRSSDRGARFWNEWREALVMDNNLHYEPLNVLSEKHASWADRKRGFAPWRFGAGPHEFARYRRATGLDAHALYAEPQFVDPARRDYRLKPGSPGTALATDGGPVGARDMPGLDRDQSVMGL